MSDGPDPDAWLVTFGDLITLLLTFFVLMLSMSSMDNKRLKAALDSFGGKPGIFQAGESSMLGPPSSENESGSLEQINKGIEIATIVEGALKTLSEETVSQPQMALDAEGEVRIKGVPYGRSIVFSGSFMFAPNSAEIRARAFPVLNSIAKVLKQGEDMISIQGHTDNREIPFDPKFRDRWDLSAGRAVNVLQYLIQKGNIGPSRFSVMGYGDSRPEISQDTEESRRRNRRVEIVITNEKHS